MLDDMAKAALVMAVMPDGTVRFPKNTRGPRMREPGLRALAELLCPADRAELIRFLNTPVQKITHREPSRP